MNSNLPKILPISCHLLEELPLPCPFWQYYDLYCNTPYSFLLDSAKQSDRLGQYSFIGGDPSLVFRAKRLKTEDSGFRVQDPEIQGQDFFNKQKDGISHHWNRSSINADIELIELVDSTGQRLEKPITTQLIAPPFECLRQLLTGHRVEQNKYKDHPVPFLSGAVGYIGYEAGHFIEELPNAAQDDLELPDIYLMFVSTVLAHCHSTGRSYLSIIGRGDDEKSARKQADDQKDKILQRIADFNSVAKGPHPNSRPTSLRTVPGKRTGVPRQSLGTRKETHVPRRNLGMSNIDAIELHGHFDKSEYCRAIETVKDHIAAGDVYQVCLTRRLDTPLIGGTAWDLYQVLRHINPAPFACFLNYPEVQIVSSSPERFISLNAEGIAESRPIKGTRPRGATPDEDQRLRFELAESTKDKAENLMIVDLVRNDIGRVSQFRTVDVPEFMLIEDYATVFQMVSTIRGRLAQGRDALDLIQACFPGGSMTGAPKIEAMKIIDQLEPVERGIYSGAIGYLDFAGPMDLNIVIRTVIVKNNRCYFHTGGGIVADSDPQEEYQETEDKALALVEALKRVHAGCRVQDSA